MQQKCHIFVFIQNRCFPSMSSYINLGSRSKQISFTIGPIKPETTLHTHQFRLRFRNYYSKKTDFNHWFKLVITTRSTYNFLTIIFYAFFTYNFSLVFFKFFLKARSFNEFSIFCLRLKSFLLFYRKKTVNISKKIFFEKMKAFAWTCHFWLMQLVTVFSKPIITYPIITYPYIWIVPLPTINLPAPQNLNPIVFPQVPTTTATTTTTTTTVRPGLNPIIFPQTGLNPIKFPN